MRGQARPNPEVVNAPREVGGQAGQHVLEYAVLLSVVAAAMVAMLIYVRRDVQANVRAMDEEVAGEVQGEALIEPTVVEMIAVDPCSEVNLPGIC
ncbi:MAG: hypothetical protein HY597_04300 [Candidatus Omnitrophica bacterium]|nr:hypothetical protein [Candidatus Omnitrophota bacterium]